MITLPYISFMSIEMNFLLLFLVIFTIKSMNICNESINYDKIII